MGWGVSHSLESPGRPKPLRLLARATACRCFENSIIDRKPRQADLFLCVCFTFPCAFQKEGTLNEVEFKPIEQLVPVSFMHYCTSTPGLSTWWSTTALIGKPCFEGGFTLRCLQHLSRPHIATQRCSWRNNWYTRGASIPVLSY